LFSVAVGYDSRDWYDGFSKHSLLERWWSWCLFMNNQIFAPVAAHCGCCLLVNLFTFRCLGSM
jgi:hypothetical protein